MQSRLRLSIKRFPFFHLRHIFSLVLLTLLDFGRINLNISISVTFPFRFSELLALYLTLIAFYSTLVVFQFMLAGSSHSALDSSDDHPLRDRDVPFQPFRPARGANDGNADGVYADAFASSPL